MDKELLSTLIEKFDFLWRLDGNMNLLVQGVSLEPDFQIAVNDEGLEQIRENFPELVLQDYCDEEKHCETLLLYIDGKEIEANCYTDDRGMFEKVDHIQWEGIEIPILPLKDAKKFYESEGKKDIAEIIEKSL